MTKLRACTIVAIAVLTSATLNANSQCVVMTTEQAKAVAYVVVLGRVVAIERERLRSILTVEVDRVWKGMAPKRITLYQSHQGVRPTSLNTTFEVGQRYVIFAGWAFRPTIYQDYVDDCTSKPASAFNLTDLGDSRPPQE